MSAAGDAELRSRLAALFHEELQDNLQRLGTGIARLEDDPAAAPELVTELFRAAHSLKGAAHAAGVDAAVDPARRLEDRLARLRDGEEAPTAAFVEALRHDVAALAAVERALADQLRGAAADTPAAGASPRTRVDVGILDGLVREAGALVSTTQQLRAIGDRLAGVAGATQPGGGTAREVISELDALARDTFAAERDVHRRAGAVVGIAQRLRMQRIADVVAGLPAALDDLCEATGKEAVLVVTGGDIEVDRDVGDALREPLLHLVRNAIDHGIEEPDQRVRAHKPRQGTVRLDATLEGTQVRITVEDDGRGIDTDALVAVSGAAVASPEEAVALAFEPGVSTAQQVSDVSGRGVGLDAVRSRIESLGGSVQLRLAAPWGTLVDLHVPMTLAVLDVLVVTAGGHPLAMPATAVAHLSHARTAELEHVEGRLLLARGRRRAAVPLAGALGLSPGDLPETLTVIEVEGEETVLLADAVDTQIEAVVRPLPPRVAGGAGVIGAVVLVDGRVAMVVNPSSCARATADVPAPVPSQHRRALRVLLVEDTATTRALEQSILRAAGYDVLEAADGAEAFRVLNDQDVDVVVSDVDMPRMGGIELCRAMRSSPRLAQTPVVLVTSLASDEDRARGLEAGADAYIVKSAFDQDALLSAVRRLA